MEESFIVIGKILSTYGNKGEIKIIPLTNSIERFSKLVNVFIKKGKDRNLLKVINVKIKKNKVILQLEDIKNIEQAEKIIGSFLEVKRSEAIKLPKDSYFIFDIIGLDVYTNQDQFLGKVDNIINTGSNDVYVIKNNSTHQEILVPAIREVIEDINLEKRRITINAIEGLI